MVYLGALNGRTGRMCTHTLRESIFLPHNRIKLSLMTLLVRDYYRKMKRKHSFIHEIVRFQLFLFFRRSFAPYQCDFDV